MRPGRTAAGDSLAPFTLFVLLAHAQDVLWYHGNGGYEALPDDLAADMEATLSVEGSTGIAIREAWPPRIDDFELVFIVKPTTSFTEDQVADLRSFVWHGGTLVLVSENSTFWGVAEGLNRLLAALDLSSTFVGATLDTGCDRNATVVASGRLTDGFSGAGPAYTTTDGLTRGAAAVQVLQGMVGSTVLAVEDHVILSTDSNIFDPSSCGYNADNRQLLVNLYRGLCDADQDLDLDGFGDQWCGGDDCDDADPTANPGAPDVCNGVDDDCDGLLPGEEDVDGDGYLACADCDDGDGAVNAPSTWYPDSDGDGDGASGGSIAGCGQPEGYVGNASDCDDADLLRHTGATEVCGGVDDDCDGEIDEDLADAACDALDTGMETPGGDWVEPEAEHENKAEDTCGCGAGGAGSLAVALIAVGAVGQRRRS